MVLKRHDLWFENTVKISVSKNINGNIRGLKTENYYLKLCIKHPYLVERKFFCQTWVKLKGN